MSIHTTETYSNGLYRLNIPIVVVKDSGGAADLLALAYRNCYIKEIVKDHRGKEYVIS